MHSRSRAFAPPAMSPRLPRLVIFAAVWVVWPAIFWALIAWAFGAFGAEPVSNCTMTRTDGGEQYYSDCGPPSEPSHTHDASPS